MILSSNFKKNKKNGYISPNSLKRMSPKTFLKTIVYEEVPNVKKGKKVSAKDFKVPTFAQIIYLFLCFQSLILIYNPIFYLILLHVSYYHITLSATFDQYEWLLENNYNCLQLKNICRFYKLKISGNKPELNYRVWNYLKYSFFSRKKSLEIQVSYRKF